MGNFSSTSGRFDTAEFLQKLQNEQNTLETAQADYESRLANIWKTSADLESQLQIEAYNLELKKKRNRRHFPRWFLLFKSEQISISLEGLRNHKTRSFLTMLGIIFGVAAVISMLAIGEGARRKTMNQIQSLGLTNIIAQNLFEDANNKTREATTRLNYADLTAIRDILPTERKIVPVVESNYEARYQTRSDEITLTGAEPDYFDVMHLTIKNGGYFTSLDNTLHQRVCVLGDEIAKTLFLVEDPLGKLVKIGSLWFTIIGVLEHQPIGVAVASEVNLNNHIFFPIRSAQSRFERDPKASELDQIIVNISDTNYVVSSATLIDQILLRRHNGEKNYNLIVPEQLLRQSEETQKIFSIVMGAIAGISLLVGGIGIMNIMLASVLERTREIGIRRSLGARKKDIRNQFLIEAIILSLCGGLIGIVIGYGLSFVVTIYSDWETAVSLWSVFLSFGVSSLVGILFGSYPAKKAAELNPIDALRYE
ncbi:MAG: ABC transporter permease [Candidatus Neomarinimicrobiota bacterium]